MKRFVQGDNRTQGSLLPALLDDPAGQISLTAPDARAMATSTSRGLVGYNVQTAVDIRHHLIVAHEVTNNGSDRRQLAKMAKQAKEAIPVIPVAPSQVMTYRLAEIQDGNRWKWRHACARCSRYMALHS